MEIKRNYVLFLGDAPDQLAAKTAQGIAQWRPEWCVGQMRLPNCQADLGLPDVTLAEGRAKGAKTLILGVANRGGFIGADWQALLVQAIEAGYDLASGLHTKLTDLPDVVAAAKRLGAQLADVRHPTEDYPVASGVKRSGKRLLTVGTDCSVGKMYTTLALHAEMAKRGMNASFRATGQTGIFIAGAGLSVDAVVADFIAGAIEVLTPENTPDHWDLVEGQGSLFHASYAGVTIGLIHGAQPDALVLCHEPGRPHMRGLPGYQLPDLKVCLERNLEAARLTNPAVKAVGVALNTKSLSDSAARDAKRAAEDQLGLPAVDPLKDGVGPIVDRLW
jgi:uncharacterized NAD-dependent epimerase/dehydratase family protein